MAHFTARVGKGELPRIIVNWGAGPPPNITLTGFLQSYGLSKMLERREITKIIWLQNAIGIEADTDARAEEIVRIINGGN